MRFAIETDDPIFENVLIFGEFDVQAAAVRAHGFKYLEVRYD